MTQEIVQAPINDEKFAIDDVIGTGWQVTKERFWPLFCILGVNGLVASLVPLASFVMGMGGMSLDNIGLQMLLGIASAVIALTVEFGMLNVYLMALDGKKVNADDCFKCVKYLPSFLAVAALTKPAIALGYCFFIVPGIILQISFQFAGYFIVEKKFGPIAAIKASWTICDGARWQLVLLAIVSYFIHAFGLMCLLIGAIPAYMINSLANAATYRALLAKTPALADLAPPPQLSEAAVDELLKHDSWPEHLTPAADATDSPIPAPQIASAETSGPGIPAASPSIELPPQDKQPEKTEPGV